MGQGPGRERPGAWAGRSELRGESWAGRGRAPRHRRTGPAGDRLSGELLVGGVDLAVDRLFDFVVHGLGLWDLEESGGGAGGRHDLERAVRVELPTVRGSQPCVDQQLLVRGNLLPGEFELESGPDEPAVPSLRRLLGVEGPATDALVVTGTGHVIGFDLDLARDLDEVALLVMGRDQRH